MSTTTDSLMERQSYKACDDHVAGKQMIDHSEMHSQREEEREEMLLNIKTRTS